MPKVLKVSAEKPAAALITEAVGMLQQGAVIAYPTETFYGLGVDAYNEEAVKKIFRIKGRNFNQPISVIIGSVDDLRDIIIDPPDISVRLMQEFWPGPLTLVFRASPSLSKLLTADTGKIGSRISSHPIAAAIAKMLRHPITATSANLSGAKECSSASEIIDCIGDKVDLVIDGGPTTGFSGSTILDVSASPPVILREGAIPALQIQSFLGH
jgi:L-threonylcarbamoyladenylate synthase